MFQIALRGWIVRFGRNAEQSQNHLPCVLNSHLCVIHTGTPTLQTEILLSLVEKALGQSWLKYQPCPISSSPLMQPIFTSRG